MRVEIEFISFSECICVVWQTSSNVKFTMIEQLIHDILGLYKPTTVIHESLIYRHVRLRYKWKITEDFATA